MLGKKGKTNYNFPSNADSESIVQSWLSANGFRKLEGTNTYQAGDRLVQGLRFFEYEISGNEVKISVFFGSPEKPVALTDGLAGAIPSMEYKNLLTPLFAALDNNQSTTNQETETMPTNNTYNNFQAATDKRKTTCAEISFWVSILLLISSFAGISMSVILVIVNYYLAAQGLKTKKRGKSIAAIVMTSISIVILIFIIIANL